MLIHGKINFPLLPKIIVAGTGETASTGTAGAASTGTTGAASSGASGATSSGAASTGWARNGNDRLFLMLKIKVILLLVNYLKPFREELKLHLCDTLLITKKFLKLSNKLSFYTFYYQKIAFIL